ncbi:MAG: DUF1080 domain-containing protein [Bacteroidetes bacterium]|nr:DUF1080 domain-containing protein [Bacteroidota bacterium]
MKPALFGLTSLVVLFALQSCSQGKKEWKPLFGDEYAEAEFEKGSWEVREDALVAFEDKVVWAMGEYENFKLEFELMNEVGTNSGIIVYCTNKENWIPNSVEIQIADDHCEKWGTARKDYQCGAIFGHLPASEQKVVKQPGEWNNMEISCQGQMIEVVLNGKKVTTMDMSLWTSGTSNPDGSEIPSWLPAPFADLPTKGFIGFQGKHGESSVSFRNVRIMEL